MRYIDFEALRDWLDARARIHLKMAEHPNDHMRQQRLSRELAEADEEAKDRLVHERQGRGLQAVL